MKKLKCEVCSKEWYVEDSKMDEFNTCPFCEISIQEKIVISEFNSLDKAIYSAIMSRGIEILQHPQQLLGYLMDIEPKLKKEIRIFSKIFNEEYMIYVKDIFEKKGKDMEAAIEKLRYLLIENEGLSEKWVDMICGSLFGAVSYINKDIENKDIDTSNIVDNTDNTTDVKFSTPQLVHKTKKKKIIIIILSILFVISNMNTIIGSIPYLIISAICGAIAGNIMNNNKGFLFNIILGLIGGIVGGIIFEILGVSVSGFIGNIICGVIGSCIVIYIVRFMSKFV